MKKPTNAPNETIIGNRLRTLRRERKMKQVDVAEAVGISRSYLASIERGHDAPGRETLMALATYFDISLDLLASAPGELPTGKSAAQNQEEALLLYAYRALPVDESKLLLQMLLTRVKPKGASN